MTQELIERLEPCPFCGESDGEETALYVTWDTRQGRTVLCNACGAYGPSCPGPNEAEAIAAWNTRDQSQSARIAELEGAGTKLLSAWDDSNWDEDVRQAIRDFRASLTKDSTSG